MAAASRLRPYGCQPLLRLVLIAAVLLAPAQIGKHQKGSSQPRSSLGQGHAASVAEAQPGVIVKCTRLSHRQSHGPTSVARSW